MSVAWLFPGQGMEVPRMGLALTEHHAGARALLASVGDHVGLDPMILLASGGRAMEQTEILQPMLLAVSLGVAEALTERAPRPAFVAGHSLGELAAWAVAGGISSAAAIALARVRGLAMGAAAARHPGGMVALQMGAPSVRDALATGQGQGVIDLGAHNAPSEWVLSGEHAALRAVAKFFPVRRLAVAGPWHGRLMAEAVPAFASAVNDIRAAATGPGLVANRTGELASGDEIPRLVVEQLHSPVLWAGTLRALVDSGVNRFVTVGPGRVLRGLIRKNLGSTMPVYTTDDPTDLARSCEALAASTRTP